MCQAPPLHAHPLLDTICGKDFSFHPMFRLLICRRTLRDALFHEARPFVGLPRPDVVAAERQVRRPVLVVGATSHRVDELTGDTQTPGCRRHPHRDQLDPLLPYRLPAEDAEHCRLIVRHESQRNLREAELPFFGRSVDPVGVSRTAGGRRLGQPRQARAAKPFPIRRASLSSLSFSPEVLICLTLADTAYAWAVGLQGFELRPARKERDVDARVRELAAEVPPMPTASMT